jgi:hypothetical protein
MFGVNPSLGCPSLWHRSYCHIKETPHFTLFPWFPAGHIKLCPQDKATIGLDGPSFLLLPQRDRKLISHTKNSRERGSASASTGCMMSSRRLTRWGSVDGLTSYSLLKLRMYPCFLSRWTHSRSSSADPLWALTTWLIWVGYAPLYHGLPKNQQVCH